MSLCGKRLKWCSPRGGDWLYLQKLSHTFFRGLKNEGRQDFQALQLESRELMPQGISVPSQQRAWHQTANDGQLTLHRKIMHRNLFQSRTLELRFSRCLHKSHICPQDNHREDINAAPKVKWQKLLNSHLVARKR